MRGGGGGEVVRAGTCSVVTAGQVVALTSCHKEVYDPPPLACNICKDVLHRAEPALPSPRTALRAHSKSGAAADKPPACDADQADKALLITWVCSMSIYSALLLTQKRHKSGSMRCGPVLPARSLYAPKRQPRSFSSFSFCSEVLGSSL